MNGKYTSLSIGVYRWKGIAKATDTNSRVTAESIFRVFTCSRRSSIIRGSPGESDNEILMLDLVNSFNPSRREFRVPE